MFWIKYHESMVIVNQVGRLAMLLVARRPSVVPLGPIRN